MAKYKFYHKNDSSKVVFEGDCLRWANLHQANLAFTDVFSFTLGQHFGFAHEGYVRIGCEGHSLQHWLKNYRSIGEKHRYSDKHIEAYERMLGLIDELNALLSDSRR